MTKVDFCEMSVEAVSSVLSTMFFTEPLGLTEELPEGEVMESRLVFQGSTAGTFNLRISTSGARLIAAAFLGTDEDSLTPAEMGQVACELTNMLCGSFVSRLESDISFDLASPELVPAGTLGSCQDPTGRRQSFELESGILTVALCMEAS